MTTKKLLYQATLEECGHRLQVWAEEFDDGSWRLHAFAPCGVCQAVIAEVVHREYPKTPIVVTD